MCAELPIKGLPDRQNKTNDDGEKGKRALNMAHVLANKEVINTFSKKTCC